MKDEEGFAGGYGTPPSGIRFDAHRDQPLEPAMAIALFFIGHWMSSVFLQSFFLHRYGAHKQFSMSRSWEQFFHVCTYLAQGSSFLSARAYAVLHRMHHAYSDGPKDPHSPQNHANVFAMMLVTKEIFENFSYGRQEPEPRFANGAPYWARLDRLSQSWVARALWMGAYTAFYAAFASAWWQWLLLPAHFVMGPIHGAIVNWCGHRYGYRNFDTDDVSRNTLAFDFLTLGELFQNNHHRHAMRPNFAVRSFEIDPTWHVIRLLAWFGIIELRPGHAEVDATACSPRDSLRRSPASIPPRTPEHEEGWDE